MRQKGFTLIELLAVIVILAILIALAVPKIVNYIETAKESSLKNNTNTVMDMVNIEILNFSKKNWYGDYGTNDVAFFNNYLESQLEKINSGSTTNKYSNKASIINPYNKQTSILDYDDVITDTSNEGYRPALFMTANTNYSYESTSSTDALIGTIVIYFKTESGIAQQMQIYYVNKDGSKSDFYKEYE